MNNFIIGYVGFSLICFLTVIFYMIYETKITKKFYTKEKKSVFGNKCEDTSSFSRSENFFSGLLLLFILSLPIVNIWALCLTAMSFIDTKRKIKEDAIIWEKEKRKVYLQKAGTELSKFKASNFLREELKIFHDNIYKILEKKLQNKLSEDDFYIITERLIEDSKRISNLKRLPDEYKKDFLDLLKKQNRKMAFLIEEEEKNINIPSEILTKVDFLIQESKDELSSSKFLSEITTFKLKEFKSELENFKIKKMPFEKFEKDLSKFENNYFDLKQKIESEAKASEEIEYKKIISKY